ncbi:MAG: transaldolase [Porticoccaceae bacterium]
MDNPSLLDQLKTMTTVVADTGDFAAIEQYQPEDATTNPSLVLKAAQLPAYRPLVDAARAEAAASASNSAEQMSLCMDALAVAIGHRVLQVIPGRISTEVDARLSFDTAASVAKAQQLIGRYEQLGVGRERVLIKMATTWEGVRAAEQLEREGINCNLTLLFNLTQAAAAADAGAFLISPFVGRILDWHKAQSGRDFAAAEDPGVLSVTQIYNYFKQRQYATVVMGASFRNIGEITQLAGCDRLTISPALLEELATTYAALPRKLDPQQSGAAIHYTPPSSSAFAYQINSDAMAHAKLGEGIRAFVADQEKLENWLLELG